MLDVQPTVNSQTTHDRVNTILISDPGVIWHHFRGVNQQMFFPNRTKRGLLEGSASDGECDGCSRTCCNQLVNDRSQKLVGVKYWV